MTSTSWPLRESNDKGMDLEESIPMILAETAQSSSTSEQPPPSYPAAHCTACTCNSGTATSATNTNPASNTALPNTVIAIFGISANRIHRFIYNFFIPLIVFVVALNFFVGHLKMPVDLYFVLAFFVGIFYYIAVVHEWK
ncbi:hypothetical protein HDV05_005533 [Chytridiales sp. JEL 0842]|nr:hypothetical protein HDV05_005533 [Chytridiales sp. JEL 0842]